MPSGRRYISEWPKIYGGGPARERRRVFAEQTEAQAMARLKVVGVIAAAVVAAYWVATLAGVPSSVLRVVFTVVLPLVPPLGWWAAARALPHLRRFTLLAAAAITCEGIGTLLWYVAFLQNGSKIPAPPGFWTPFLHMSLVLGVAAAWTGVRDAVRPRPAVLDYSVVFAAGACLAVAVFERQLRSGWSLASLDAAFRPVVDVLLVTLIASAGLGRWQGLPLPVGLLALGQLFTVGGDLLFAYYTARDAYTEDRWTDLLWLTGAVIAMVTAASLILRIDRPIRLARQPLPGVSPLALLIATLGAFGLTATVTVHGALSGNRAALFAGLAAGAWIGLAAPLRTLGALRECRVAYQRLDQAHFSLERASEQLAQRNTELTAIQTMLGPLFELADERSDGELRSRLEETAEEITGWLPPPERGA
jgi:hypothetical protein